MEIIIILPTHYQAILGVSVMVWPFIILRQGNPQIHGRFFKIEEKGFVHDKLLKGVEHVDPNQVGPSRLFQIFRC